MTAQVSPAPLPAQNRARLSAWVDISMLFVSMVWGGNFAVVKHTLREISPMAFSSIRFFLASVFIVLMLMSQRENLRIHGRDWWRILILGICGITICQVLFIQGIARTTAGNASLLVGGTPIFVTVLSALLRLECVSVLSWIGVALSFVGTAIIIGAGPSGLNFSDQTLVGNVMILFSTLSWSVYTLLSQSLMRRYSPLKITTLAMLTGTPFLLLLSAGELWRQAWLSVSVRGWLGVFYSFFLASAVGFVIWNNSVQKAGNTRTAIFSNLVPVVAVLVSWLFLNETLRLWQMVGAFITLTGVTLARIGPRKARVCK